VFLRQKTPGRWKKSKNPVILCAIHDGQNPKKSIPDDGWMEEDMSAGIDPLLTVSN
jgi:hypothetical protein